MPASADPAIGPSTIVVGVDFSPASHAALAWAIGEANASERDIVAAHVWQPTEERRMSSCLSADLYRWDLQTMLDRVVRAAPISAVPLQAALIDGEPRTTLVRLTKHAAMLVLGKSTSRWFGASLTRYCLRNASCAVVTVSQHKPARRKRASVSSAGQRMVARFGRTAQ